MDEAYWLERKSALMPLAQAAGSAEARLAHLEFTIGDYVNAELKEGQMTYLERVLPPAIHGARLNGDLDGTYDV